MSGQKDTMLNTTCIFLGKTLFKLVINVEDNCIDG